MLTFILGNEIMLSYQVDLSTNHKNRVLLGCPVPACLSAVFNRNTPRYILVLSKRKKNAVTIGLWMIPPRKPNVWINTQCITINVAFKRLKKELIIFTLWIRPINRKKNNPYYTEIREGELQLKGHTGFLLFMQIWAQQRVKYTYVQSKG